MRKEPADPKPEATLKAPAPTSRRDATPPLTPIRSTDEPIPAESAEHTIYPSHSHTEAHVPNNKVTSPIVNAEDVKAMLAKLGVDYYKRDTTIEELKMLESKLPWKAYSLLMELWFNQRPEQC